MFCLLIGFTHEYVLLSCHFYIHTLFTGSHHSILRHLKDDHEVIPILTSLLTLSHPAQERLATLRGSIRPYPLRVGFFTSHKNQISESAVRRDLRFFFLIRED